MNALEYGMLLGFATLVGALHDKAGDEIIIKCEPKNNNRTANHFVRQYNMRTDVFTFADLYHSIDSTSRPQAYLVRLNIKKTNRFEAFRKVKVSTISFHFYYGDTMTCHHFNPETGEYSRQQIGFHTGRHFCIFPPGHYYSLDFERHQGEKFALIGVVSLWTRRRATKNNLSIHTRDEMIKLFPQHEKIIQKYYAKKI